MRTKLTAFKLGLPSGTSDRTIAGWLDVLATSTHPRSGIISPPPVAVEVQATKAGISHYLLYPHYLRRMVLTTLRAALPVRLEDAADYAAEPRVFTLAAELAVAGGSALAYEQAQAANAAVLATMQPLYGTEQALVQLIVGTTGTAALVGRSTQRRPMLRLALRVGVSASRRERAGSLLQGVMSGFRLLNTPESRIVRRPLPSSLVAGRIARRSSPYIRPIITTTQEAAGLFPMAPGVPLPGLSSGGARQLPPPDGLARAGCVIAHANYPGLNRPLALLRRDRLMHTYVVGPTGVGKSTLLVNMALQDIAAGLGLVFIDPKGDAIPELLARLAPERQADVTVIDPAAVGGNVIGWNVLDMPGGELARELAVDHTVHVLRELWRGSWGPRTADVLRASLLTLVHTRAPDGSAFAITDVPELLTNERFRRFVLAQPGVPLSVRGFWDEYGVRSDSDRATVIGPSLNKLRAFSTRTALRVLLGQSGGLQLQDVFTKRRILLVSLGKGTIGPEAAQLLGSLLVSGIWQACLGRVSVAADRRRTVMCYIDEAHDVMRLPLSLEDMTAQARGLGMGLVLANQSLGQLSESMQSAMLGVVRTQIAFQTGFDDANKLARSFSPLTARELQELAAHEVAVRACAGGRTLQAVTGTTAPLSAVVRDAAVLADQSRQRFGVARADVEAALLRRHALPQDFGNIGRQRRAAA